MNTKTTTLILAAVALILAAAATPALAAGTPAGTAITNQASVSFQDSNGNSATVLSNVVTTTVIQVAGVTINPNSASQTVTTFGDVPYAHTVTNDGNNNDTVNMTDTSSEGWTVTFYFDTNGDGTFDAGDAALTDTDGDGNPDTGVLAPDASVDIWVVVTVPAGAADGTVDTTTVTATSAFDNTVFDQAVDTTTLSVPSVTVTKSVDQANAAPGDTLTYTIVVANNGSQTAQNVVLTDAIPANTTYVAGSITQDGTAKTDAADADNADYNVTNPGSITVDVGSLATGASTTVVFQVTVN